ncbi:GNAT family acetyltransferase [Aneurinibacillus aneurinilyticus]|jgi:hypothetical protein|uniref:GNAT family acetyltransferase n=1 Tax=Aneurinibacillus aneurinilyticus TaxID=1391 RepID=A0A848D257_ANEAE|nr:GNAT family acetyltransferase [Aneurinibacillus aneurinilyticus]
MDIIIRQECTEEYNMTEEVVKKAPLWGIKAPFEVPEESFMALELRGNAL